MTGSYPSKRWHDAVVFHCPACFADRIGAIQRGRWRPWPGERVEQGDYIECAACQAQSST